MSIKLFVHPDAKENGKGTVSDFCNNLKESLLKSLADGVPVTLEIHQDVTEEGDHPLLDFRWHGATICIGGPAIQAFDRHRKEEALRS